MGMMGCSTIEQRRWLRRKTDIDQADLLAALRDFVTYYDQRGRHLLGNGKAAQHYDQARALLERIEKGERP